MRNMKRDLLIGSEDAKVDDLLLLQQRSIVSEDFFLQNLIIFFVENPSLFEMNWYIIRKKNIFFEFIEVIVKNSSNV